jgi:hypothetical protein
MDKFVVVLPCSGAPYIFGIYGELPTLQKAVMGNIEPYDRKAFVIHPMFCDENPRWAMAQRLLNSPSTKVYVNEDGVRKCGANVATIILNPYMRAGGCPHLLGDVALVVNKRTLEEVCAHLDVLTLHKNPKTSGEDESGVWEFYNDKEEAEAIVGFKEKGYDYNEHNGFCYKRPVLPKFVAPMD